MLKYHIQTIEVGASPAGSLLFDSIPDEYDDLLITHSLRSDQSTTRSGLILSLNGSSSVTVTTLLGYNGSSISYSSVGNGNLGGVVGNTATANTFSNGQIYIANYRSSTSKSISSEAVQEQNAADGRLFLNASLFSTTSPITSVSLACASGPSFIQYSSVSLYGIKHGVDGVVEAAADGGAITQSGGYTIHTFTASGTFVANRDLDVEYLVVGGGGGGGANVGGGGGAGGYRSSVVGESSGGGTSAEPKLRVSSGESFGVVVGSGGAGNANNKGTSGSNSIFGSVTSTGGGGGGFGSATLSSRQGIVGGSGGGSSGAGVSATTAGVTGTVNQGYASGSGSSDYATYASAGGGGGAGAVGANGSTANNGASGAGGAGVASSIAGTSVSRAAGGGGGGGDGNTQLGAGGTGGGGNGGNDNTATSPTAGSVNTGSGGGGGGQVQSGAAGGSGIVIIRYPTPA